MHNCKSTINSLTDLALNELQPDEKEVLLTELEDCVSCREEYDSIRETLRVSQQALRSTLPAAEFWPGYHSRLASRLENQVSSALPAVTQYRKPWQSLWRIATASVRIPVPIVATMLLLFFGVGTALAWSLIRKTNAVPGPQTTVITRTVTVPVTQEKIVTRVVYREKNSRIRTRGSQFDDSYQRQLGAIMAQSNVDTSDKPTLSLTGFKPTDQVKLKVMKGSYRDEQ
jgi:hypothetical protein